MALGLTQPLTEMSTRNIFWGVKESGAEGWEPYHLHVQIVLKSGNLNLQEPSRPVQACTGSPLALPTEYETERASETVCALWRSERYRASVGNRTKILRLSSPSTELLQLKIDFCY
jgi:hypothetical protein